MRMQYVEHSGTADVLRPHTPALPMNLKVGQCVSPAPCRITQTGKEAAEKGAGETHCPTLTPARFRDSKRELLIRGILSLRGRGSRGQSLYISWSAGRADVLVAALTHPKNSLFTP